MATEEEKLLNEAKKFPWEQRLLHKNWKVRSEANVDLASVCSSITDPKDSRLKEFGPLFKKMVADSNAAVQEKALDALIAFLTAADADISRYAKEVCDAISAKCLTGRPKTVEKAQAVFLLWVELEASEAFLDSMEKAVKNKVAKAVVPAIDVMFQALSEFGAKVVPPKRILKMLPELFHHSDQYVRASSKGLTLELCRWIGKEPVKSILFEKMQNTMKKELETELENVTGIARPTRKLRSEQEKELEQELVIEASEAGPSGKSLDNGPQEIDEYDLVDPVDILTPLGKSGFWNGVKATKWSERKDAVAELTKLASTKKIAHGDFTEVSRTLKKLVGEVNIAVAVEAIQAIGNLAKGLRNNFGNQSRFLLPVLLEKLKDKKPTSTEALTQTLQTMYKSGCFTLPDVIEEIKAAVKNKVPLVRSSTLNWVKFCVEASNKSMVLKLQKEYLPICMECLNDGTPDVRDSSFAALAAIAKIVGMKPLEKSLEKLDEVKKKKLSDMIGPANAVKESISKPSTGGSVQNTSGILTVRSAASMLTGKKPVQAMSNNAKKSEKQKPDNSKKTEKKALPKASLTVITEDTEPINLSPKEIEDKLSNVINADMLSKLKSGVWKERLEGIGMLKEEIDKISNLDQYTELLISLLCSVPGWSEKNVQVQQRLIELITNISSSAKQLPKRCVVQCLFGISERLGDIKTRADAIKCLTGFSEAVGPGFVFDRMYKIIKEHKNPKVLSEGILWMISAVEDFGVSNLNLNDLIVFCKDTGLQSNAVATRNATVKLIGVLHKFVGPDIKGFLSDVSPTLLSAIDTEFQKNPYEGSAATPKRKIKSCDAITVMPSLDFDSLPREDISSKITPSLLKDIASPHWKVRLDSIESVNKILEQAHKKIQPIGTAELFGALKGRLHDSNKNIVMATLSTIGSLASALGPPVENSSKGILVDVLKCLGDNKKHMGESTLNTLDSWIAATHLNKMVPYIVTCLSDSKTGAEGRKYLFDWLLKQIPKLNDSSEALLLVKPVASAFVDKSSEIRKSAESVLNEILKACGKEAVTKGVKDLPKPVLAALAERLNLPCMPDDASDTSSVKVSVTKGWKSGPLNYGQGSKIGGISRPSSSRGAPMRGSNSVDSSTIKAMTNQALKALKPSQMNDKQGLNLNKPTSQEPKLGNRPSSSKGANMRALNSNNHPVQDSSTMSKALKPGQNNGKTGLKGPSSSRGGSMKGSNSVSSLQDLAANSQPLFNTSNSNKDKRAKTFAHKFKFDDLRPEQLQHLENDLLKHVREDVARRLLSKDFTKQVDAIDLLLKGLPSSGKEIIELLDVLLRWFVLRLCESNTTILMKAAKFLHDLFDFLKDQAYIFSEAEAEMFLPCLIEKCGHNQEKIRAKAQELTKQTIGIYPASKLLNYTLESLRSKNNRTRTECADLIGYLIDNHFSEISGQMKSLKIIAGLVAERDSELRKSALNTLAIAYENLGDDVWKYIGKVGDPQKSMIDERFKWKARDMQKKSQSKPVEKLRETVIEEDVESIVSVDTCMEKPIQHVETGPTNLRNALDIVVLAELPQSVEGMKIIFHQLSQAMADPKSSVIKELVEETDSLVSCFTKLIPSSFNHRISGGSSRPCKYVLNILLQIFQIKSVAQTVSERTLEELVTELLTWLLEKRVSQMDDGSQFYNALNILVPKILENADTTSCFIVLLKLLRPVPTIPESLALRNNHFSELVIICLTKMTKVVETKIREVDLERILLCVCLYFNMLKPDEIQRSPVVDITHKLISLANSRPYSECGSTVSTGSAGS